MRFYYDPIADLDQLFDGALTTCFYLTPSAGCVSSDASQPLNSFRPRMNLYESKDSNTVTATLELPGMQSEDVAIDVHQNRLTVSGELGTAPLNEEGGFAVREQRYGKFSRTLQLPFGTKSEDVKAKLEKGLLTVTFPKTTPEQQAKRIPIQ